MREIRRRGAFPLIAGFAALGAAALVATAQTSPRSAPCSSAEHRQFDFWVGTWAVSQNGKSAGTNEITRISGGCALLESWRGTGGVTGHSLNIYDSTRAVWHQTWVDSSGSLLTLEGRFQNGAMILEGASLSEPGGPSLRQRITWTPLTSGDVRQLWQSSGDDGKTWKTEFDGLYRRTSR